MRRKPNETAADNTARQHEKEHHGRCVPFFYIPFLDFIYIEMGKRCVVSCCVIVEPTGKPFFLNSFVMEKNQSRFFKKKFRYFAFGSIRCHTKNPNEGKNVNLPSRFYFYFIFSNGERERERERKESRESEKRTRTFQTHTVVHLEYILYITPHLGTYSFHLALLSSFFFFSSKSPTFD